MFHLTLLTWDGQAYELTSNNAPARSSLATRYRNDPCYTGILVRHLPLDTHAWLHILKRLHPHPVALHSDHPGEVYDAAVRSVMRGELAIYSLTRIEERNCVRGKNDVGCASFPAPSPTAALGLRLKPSTP